MSVYGGPTMPGDMCNWPPADSELPADVEDKCAGGICCPAPGVTGACGKPDTGVCGKPDVTADVTNDGKPGAVRPLVSSYNLLLAQPEGTRLGVSQGSLMLKMTVLLAESAPRRKVCYNRS